MKKFCLLLLLFSYISVIPAFAVKVIVNDNNDRRVPSRSSGPESFVQYYEVDDNYVEYSNNGVNTVRGYQLEKYRYQNLPLLKQDFRTELIGTTWHYEYENTYQQNDANTEVTEIINESATNRFHHREAADYYTKDTQKDPNLLVPCGNHEGI